MIVGKATDWIPWWRIALAEAVHANSLEGLAGNRGLILLRQCQLGLKGSLKAITNGKPEGEYVKTHIIATGVGQKDVHL